MSRYLLLLAVYLSVTGVPCHGSQLDVFKSFIDFNGLKTLFNSSAIESNGNCALCDFTVDLVIFIRRTRILNDYDTTILFGLLCQALRNEVNPTVCNDLVVIYKPSIYYIIDNNLNLRSDRVCSILLQPNNCKDTCPPTIDVTISGSAECVPGKIGNPQAEPATIAHVADLHFDPQYSTTSTAECDYPICCQTDSGAPQNVNDTAGYWTDYRDCDIPLKTVDSALQKLGSTNPTYLYFMGDIVSHRMWTTSVESNTAAINTVYSLFLLYFSNTVIFPVIGNHDMHPLNLIPPDSLMQNTQFSAQWFYQLMWDNWKLFLPATAEATVLKGGYYTVLVKPGFRVIALNNNIANIFNFWLFFEVNDYYGQLQWFVDTLDVAEKNGESVHVIMHMPNGDSGTYIPWAVTFNQIIERYCNVVKGIFYGHLHSAEINVFFKEDNINKPIAVGYNGGSVTPYSNYNPNVRIYNADRDFMNILNYFEYFVNLTEANQNTMTPLQWNQLYSFKEAYGVNSMSPADLAQLGLTMASNKTMRQQYFKSSYRYSEPALETGCNTICEQQFLCNYGKSVYSYNNVCNTYSANLS